MGRLFGALIALAFIGIGAVHIAYRHVVRRGPLISDSGDRRDDRDDAVWEVHGWRAVLIGCVEVAIGLAALRGVLHG